MLHFGTSYRVLRIIAILAAGLSLLMATSMNASAALYETTTDNENNAGTGVPDNDINAYVCINDSNHPIEFNIYVPPGSTFSETYLGVRAYDVDVEYNEIDEVSLNGIVLGTLSGKNGVVSTSIFPLDPALLQDGNNLVSIEIINSGWCANIYGGYLLADFDSTTTPATLDAGNITISGDTTTPGSSIQVEVDAQTTLPTQNVIFDLELRDTNGLPIAHYVNRSPSWPLTSGGSNPYTWSFTSPADLTGYSVHVTVYNASDFAIQDIAVKPFGISHNVVANTSSLTTSESGSTSALSIALSQAPANNVSVTLNILDNSEGQFLTEPASFTFTPLNWNVQQTAYVQGVDDAYSDGDKSYAITASWSSADPNFNGFDSELVTVTNTDNDPAGFTVSGAPFTTSEQGGSAEVTVTLTTATLAGTVTVPVNVSDSTEASLSTNELVFNSGNLSETITITGLDDAIADGDVQYQLQLGNAVTTHVEDAGYDGKSFGNYSGTNLNDDISVIDVDTSMTKTSGNEGESSEFSVVLTSQPLDDVTIHFSLPAGVEATVTDSITFTSANWMSAQTVTIDRYSDEIANGDQHYSVNYSVGSNDATYGGLEIPVLDELALTNFDDDVAGIQVDNINDTRGEAGDSTTFTVALTSEPLSSVTIYFSLPAGVDATVTNSVTFTPANWKMPQEITVDRYDLAINDQSRYTVNYTVDSADLTYDGMPITTLDGLTFVNDEGDTPDPLNPVSGVTTSGGGALNPLLLLAMGWLFAAIRRRETKLQ